MCMWIRDIYFWIFILQLDFQKYPRGTELFLFLMKICSHAEHKVGELCSLVVQKFIFFAVTKNANGTILMQSPKVPNATAHLIFIIILNIYHQWWFITICLLDIQYVHYRHMFIIREQVSFNLTTSARVCALFTYNFHGLK